MIRKYSFSFILAFSLIISLITGPVGNTSIHKTDAITLPFSVNEELNFEGEVSKAVFRGLDVADLSFKFVQDSQTKNKFNITLEATSKGFATKLFGLKFRQKIESVVETSPFQAIKTTKIDEQNKRIRKSETLFDKAANKIVWAEYDPAQANKQLRTVTNDFSRETQDLASIFYFLRTQNLKVGQSFNVPLHDSGRIYNIEVKVTERTLMKTSIGKTWTLRLVPDVFGEEKLLSGEGSVSIWFTEDPRHIPVRIQITNKIGTVDFKLKKPDAKLAKN